MITFGTTNSYVAEELLGTPIDQGAFAAGFADDRRNINLRLGESPEIVIDHGTRMDPPPEDVLSTLHAGDVVIEGEDQPVRDAFELVESLRNEDDVELAGRS